ncbi:MAG: Glutamate--cysteine ligase [Candidatus Thorarchaeota archaeon]|nr:MAG: Glutamate--cysteine ligase [Candidatus Thorarchaeota archaeon]
MSEKGEPSELELPFPQGIEVELQVVNRDGSWIRGDEVLDIFDKIVSNAKILLDKKIKSTTIESVRSKYGHSAQTEEGERGSRIVASYQDPQGVTREYTLLGHDPNVTSLTWILEVATPPCTTLEELAWWVQTLIAISYDSIPRESRIVLISTGLNPTQEYLKNLSFGEHHHILGPKVSDEVKIAVYNMIRNFIPQLISLSVNSPFENKVASDEILVDEKGRTRAPRCKRSIRLWKNTTQMGPSNEFEYIPYLKTADKDAFARHVNRSPPRMVDMYPFTDYGTIEIRVTDTQLSVPRRIGIALILQALSLKAKRMLEKGETIPDVGAQTLAANREAAIAAGLWGPFRPGRSADNPEYMKKYNYQTLDDGTVSSKKRNRFLGDAVISMLYIIRDELEELNAIDNPFFQALLISIYGSETVEPRTTGADFQLDVYAKSDFNMVVLLKRLAEITRECCTNWLYDPLDGTPQLPTWLCWWKGIEPEIVIDADKVFSGQIAHFMITIKNSLDRDITNLTIKYTIEDSDRNVVEENIVPIAKIESGEIHLSRLSFQTERGVSAYNVFAAIGIAGREIPITGTISTYWMRVTARPGTTTQFVDGKTPVRFSGEIDTNYPFSTQVDCRIEVLLPSKEKVIASVSGPLEIERGELRVINQDDFPPLIIPEDTGEGVQRCILQVSLHEETGNEITSGTSRPFYAGFVKKGPQVLLRTDAKEAHSPGEIIHGEVAIKTRGKKISPNASVHVVFHTDAGEIFDIASVRIADLSSDSVAFRWRVPTISNDAPEARTGAIKAWLEHNEEKLSSTESNRLRIAHLGVRVSIDSLRAPTQSEIGKKITGWLRIRRNTELGEPSNIEMLFRFPSGEEHLVLKQSVKQSRNLSFAFGPLEVPEPKDEKNPSHVTLVARLLYGGVILDQKTQNIDLGIGTPEEIAQIKFSGIPKFVLPDETIAGTLHITNISSTSLDCILNVYLESTAGTEHLISRNLTIVKNGTKLIPTEFKIPLIAEMSTAQLKVVLECAKRTFEGRLRLKIKAIEEPVFNAQFTIRNQSGEEIPGLVQRVTPITINVELESKKGGFQNLQGILKILSRREVVKEFNIEIPDTDTSNYQVELEWITPDVMVTAYYLELILLKQGKTLPARAIHQPRKQFTVY